MARLQLEPDPGGAVRHQLDRPDHRRLVRVRFEQQQHNQAAQAFGPDGYIWHWLKATMENWQSEFLQLFTFVVLTTFLIHPHSHESRDEQDVMKAQIEVILARLEEKR